MGYYSYQLRISYANSKSTKRSINSGFAMDGDDLPLYRIRRFAQGSVGNSEQRAMPACKHGDPEYDGFEICPYDSVDSHKINP